MVTAAVHANTSSHSTASSKCQCQWRQQPLVPAVPLPTESDSAREFSIARRASECQVTVRVLLISVARKSIQRLAGRAAGAGSVFDGYVLTAVQLNYFKKLKSMQVQPL